ncbi:tumor necrosis factor ligand superfamily member 13B [Centropristis striata]|uniref:tumor necrosis factor ligand superfamily member 13B n=1 Tax=Centropristis striata TaxID=184440 RepID=UPI0027DF597A|nr:tumor necrosis factor ligand superfamily member 13B [Centropristis striata]
MLPCELSRDYMGPVMEASAGVKSETGQRTSEGRLSWPVFLLTLAAVTSSSLSALSLYQLVALRAEVEGLKSEVYRRREGGREDKSAGETDHISQESLHQPESKLPRDRRAVSATQPPVSQPCLQLMPDNSRKTFGKEHDSDPHTGIPWQPGLSRGTALEIDGDCMVVREEGAYFVYSQVYYMDKTFAMGHVVIRRKRNVVGDEPQYVVLFRCIQTMNPVNPYNTCYTGGIVKLEVGDQLELLIPRSTANVSVYGDSTFLGAFKLA